MADDDELLDEEEDVEPEDLDEEDLEDLEEDVLDEDDEDVLDEEEDEEEEEGGVAVATKDEDEDEDDDDELVGDDVEASLDEILKERLVVADDEDEDEEDETPEPDDRGDAGGKVLPKQPDEFVCQSCFLVKHPSQLADADRMYCRDCV